MLQRISTETKIFISVIVGTLILVGASSFFLAGKSSDNKVFENGEQILQKSSKNSIGQENAKVVFVEFSDFECPACKSSQPIVKKIIEEYKDKNFRYVFKHFPLPSHKQAFYASQAVEAAGNQGKFWEMHDLVFEKSPDLSNENLFNYAQSLGLDMDKFKTDFNSNEVKQIINSDFSDGEKLNMTVTPTFFINNKKFNGALSYEEFKKEIDAVIR